MTEPWAKDRIHELGGYCVAVAAEQDNRKLIGVVMDAPLAKRAGTML